MAAISTKVETQTYEDADGNVTTTTKSSSIAVERNTEPDYIKLYTRMWCEFNQIPEAYRNLFLELVVRMSYCKTTDLGNSQLVNTGKPWSESIMSNLNWKEAMYFRGLKELAKCGAIRKVGRGVYQINPDYAGKGEWKYNPRLDRGGVEDLKATFNFKSGSVDTEIIWGDDGTGTMTDRERRSTPYTELSPDDAMRVALGVKDYEKDTVLKSTTFYPDDLPGQMTIGELPDLKGAV